MTHESPHLEVLDYASPVAAEKPRRWWVLFVCALCVACWEWVQPNQTPPGWPMTGDYVAMLLVPIGAIVIATTTSIPGSVIGIFGAMSVFVFIPGQLGDGRFKFVLNSAADVNWVLLKWCGAQVLAWAVCRSAALLRGEWN